MAVTITPCELFTFPARELKRVRDSLTKEQAMTMVLRELDRRERLLKSKEGQVSMSDLGLAMLTEGGPSAAKGRKSR